MEKFSSCSVICTFRKQEIIDIKNVTDVRKGDRERKKLEVEKHKEKLHGLQYGAYISVIGTVSYFLKNHRIQ